MKALPSLFLLAAVGAFAPPLAADGEWVDGVAYTTDWDDAIEEVRETGKILLIYNGWERPDI